MRIDIHAQYWTGGCLDLLADLVKTDEGTLRGLDAGDGQEFDARLRLIDRAGADVQALSAPAAAASR